MCGRYLDQPPPPPSPPNATLALSALGLNAGFALMAPAALQQAGYPEAAIAAWLALPAENRTLEQADQDLLNRFVVRAGVWNEVAAQGSTCAHGILTAGVA